MAKKLNVSLAFTADASQAKAELNALQKSLSELVSGVALKTPDFKFTKGIQEATRAAAQLKTQLESAVNIKTGNLDLTKFSEAMSKSGMSLEKYQNQLYQLGPVGEKAFADLTRSITMADVPLKRSSKLLDELWTTMKNTARWQLTSSAMHGFMGAVQSAYGYAQDLNKSLNDIRIVTGASTDKMASFAQEANIAAKALSTTTTAYTNASLIFYQQGLSDSEVAARTEVTIKMANAAGASAEKVSEQLTAVWNNFYDGSKSLEYYADVMTALGAATATSTDEISQGLQKFAAVADTVGLSYEYATAALATITSNTRESADVVGTALKTLFARIQGLQLGETLEDGTNLNKYSEALATVGISIYESNGELKAMDNILNEMAAKWDTMSNAQQVALAQTVAGVRQYTQLIALMDNWNVGDSDSMLANLKTVENASGSLQDQADIYAESWDAASKRVRASAEAVYSAILNDEFFIDLTNGFADITDGVKVFIDSLGGVKGLLLAIGSIVTNVFSKQIGQALSNAAFSLQGFLNPQAIINKQMAQKEKANKLLQQGYKDDDTISGRQNAQVYEALGSQQLSYIQNAENMSEEELAINQILMDRNRLLADQAIAAGERLQKTEEQIKAERNSLEIQARIEAGKNGGSLDLTKFRAARTEVEKLTKAESTLKAVGDQLNNTPDLDATSEEFQKLKGNVENVIKDMAKLDNLDPNNAESVQKLATALGIADKEARTLMETFNNSGSVGNLQSAISDLAVAAGTNAATKINELKQAMTNAGISADVADDLIRQYTNVIKEFGPNSVQAREALDKLKTGVQTLTEEIDRAKPKPIELGQAFSKAASAIMAVGQAINTIKGIIDVFKDDNATTGDKILAVVSAIGMLIPAIVSVTGALGKVPIAAAGANTALTGTAATATAAGTAISLSMWQLTLIVAAITAIVAIIIACADAIHKASPEGEFEAASKAAEQAADAASKVQEEYEQIIDTLDGLDEGIEKIHDMERGTLEWRQAIIESNNALIELLSTYGMLDSKNFTVDADGIMQITDEARKLLLEQQSLAVQQANNANYMAQVDKNNARTRLEASESAGDLTLWRSNGDYMYDAVTDNSQLSANIGMAIGEALAQGRLQSEDLTDVSKLTGVLSEVNGLYGQEAEMLARQIVANEDLITSFGELGASVTATTEANRILNNQIIESNFGDQIDNSGFDDASREDLTNMMGKALEDEADRLYQSKYRDKGALGGGITDAEIQKAYAEAMGWATDTIDNQNGNKAKYYAKDGKEIGVISDEVARKYLAQQEAIKQMGGDVQGYINTLNELIQVGNNIGEGVGEALGTFAGGQHGDLSSLNSSQLNELKNQVSTMQSDGTFKIGDQVIDEAYAKKLGYETVQAYYDAIQNEIAATEEALDVNKLADSMGITQVINGVEKTYNTAGESFKKLFADNSALDEMTAGQKQAFAKAYKRIFEEGGAEALDIVDKVIVQAGDKGDELADLISQTNWNDANSADNFIKQMEEMGIKIDGFDATNFVNEMKEIYGSVNNFTADQFREEFAELSEIVSGLGVGDTISAEDYAKLGEGYSEYFTLMADGTYKLTGDAEEFYNTVMQNKRQELMNSIQDNKKILEESQAQYEAAGKSMGNMDATTIGESQMYSDETGKLWYNGGNVTDQVDFIEQMGGVSADQIAAWREELSDGTAPVETLNAIAEAAGNCGAEYNAMGAEIEANKQALENSVQAAFTSVTSLEDLHRVEQQVRDIMGENGVNIEHYASGLKVLASQYEHCADEVEAYNNAIMSGDMDKAIEALDEMEASVMAGEMADEFDLSAEAVEDYAKRLKTLNKELGLSSKDAVKLATANMRLDRGIGNLNDNLKDYQKALASNNKGSAEWSQTLSDLKTDLADILNVADGSMLSDTFAEATLASDDLKKALDGDTEALLRLRLAAADDIIANLEVDDSSLAIANDRWNYLKENMAAGLAAGNVDQTHLINAFNEMIAAGNMTREQIEAALAGLNVSANVHTEYIQQKVKVPTSITEEYATVSGYVPYDYPKPDGTIMRVNAPLYKRYSRSYEGEPAEVEGYVPKYTIEGTTDGSGSVTTGFTALPTPSVSRSQTTSGKKSSGGGGGKTSEPKTSNAPSKADKQDETHKSDTVKRYKEIDDSLDDLADSYERANREADKLFGVDKLKAIEKENKLLQEQQKLIEKKAKEAKKYMASDKAELDEAAKEAGLSFSYDENGNITNYTDQMTILHNQLANAEKEYNRMVDDYNAEIDAAVAQYGNELPEEVAKRLEGKQDAIEAYEENILSQIRDKITSVEDAMALYEESKELYEELGLEAEDIANQIKENNYRIISEGLELRITLNEDDLELIEYQLGKLEEDFYSMAEAIALMVGSGTATLGGDGTQLGEYIDNLNHYKNTMEELERAYAAGEITEASYVEGMKEVRSGMLENLQSIQELDDAMMNYYEETLAAGQEELDKYTSKMEHQTAVLEHYMSIMEILGKSQDYESLGVILEAQARSIGNEAKVAKENYEMLQSQADAKKAAYEAASTPEEAELLKKEWEAAQIAANEAQDEMLSKTEEWAEAMTAVAQNKLKGLGQALEDALTAGFGGSFDAMTTSMERVNSLQEEYLTTTNQIYETNKLMHNVQKEIDKTSNDVAKRKMKDFITETKQLQDQTKLSKYELDIQKAKYDLLLAEIALEEAQSAKSTVRLQRDSEGNFGYVYTADKTAVDNAQQAFEDAQNNLYNIGLEGTNNYTQKYQETLNEFYDTMTSLQEQYLDGEFQNEEEYQAAMQSAREFYYAKLQEYSSLNSIALSTDARVVEDAWTKEFRGMTQQTDLWMQNVDGYVRNVMGVFDEWQTQMAEVRKTTVGPDLVALKENTQEIVDASDALAEAITKDGGVIDALEREYNEVSKITGAYAQYRDVIADLIAQYDGFMGRINTTINTAAGTGNSSPTPGPEGFASGGYTGEWGPGGKLAMLHQKELILKEGDTENFLASLEVLRDIIKVIDLHAMNAQLGGLLNSPQYHDYENGKEVLEQNVHIEANFPEVTDRYEIEAALTSIVNRASQFTNRK